MPEAVRVSIMSLLEGVLSQASVVLSAPSAGSGYCCMVDKLVSQALPIQRAGCCACLAVTASCLVWQFLLVLERQVVSGQVLAHVWHAAVGNFECVLVKYFPEW